MSRRHTLKLKTERITSSSLYSFNSVRLKLADTPHGITGKHVHSTRSDKMNQAHHNTTGTQSGTLRHERTYYADMTGLRTGTIF